MVTIDLINTLLAFWVKPFIVLSVFYWFVKNSFRKSASSSYSFLLLGIVTCLIVLLFGQILQPVYFNFLPQFLIPGLNSTIFDTTLSFFSGPNIVTYTIIAVYIFVCLTHLLNIWHDWRVIERLISQSDAPINNHVFPILDDLKEKLGIKRKVVIWVSHDVASPLTCGFFTPKILLPYQYVTWNSERLTRVLTHELAHIKRHDWAYKILVKIACSLLWFVSPIWTVAAKLNWYAEIASDDLVIKTHNCNAEYAEDLLELSADHSHGDYALGFIRNSELYERILFVLDVDKNRKEISRTRKINALLGFMIVAFFVSKIHATAIPVYSDMDAKQHDLIVYEIEDQNNEEDKKSTLTFKNIHELRKAIELQKDSPLPSEEHLISLHEIPEVPQFNLGLAPRELPLAEDFIESPSVYIRGYLPRSIVTPKYPAKALKENIEGRVIVQFDVSSKGKVINPRIVSAEPKEHFDKAVLSAIKRFRFSPLTINNTPIITKNVTETFVFTLSGTTEPKKTTTKPKATKLALKQTH